MSIKLIVVVIDRVENMVEKEKILVTTIFSFSYDVFKNFPFHGHLELELCHKGLSLSFVDSTDPSILRVSPVVAGLSLKILDKLASRSVAYSVQSDFDHLFA